jgi:hypothetical protein
MQEVAKKAILPSKLFPFIFVLPYKIPIIAAIVSDNIKIEIARLKTCFDDINKHILIPIKAKVNAE